MEDRDGILLFRVDDLKEIICENITIREDEAKACYVIVGRYTIEFFDWLKSLSVEPMIKEIYLRAEQAALAETERVISKGFIPATYREEAQKMNEQVLKRFLHDLSTKIRDVSGETKADILVESLQFLLGEKGENLPDEYQHDKEGNKK